MSAAATAAGYLYASGRLRGRAQREQEEGHKDTPEAHGEAESQRAPRPQRAERPRMERPRSERPKVASARPEVRVAALPPEEPKPRKTPVIQYRTRRWRPHE
ncbi:MAG: hypothetical protein ABR570_07950 [Burkholderiales bacterium]